MRSPHPRMIHNPVLRGFAPDPSICRVGKDYYLATSTFEWSPGVRLHHSRDLADWRLIGHALTEPRLIDLRGTENSAGVWAPQLSYHDELFYLVYSNLHNRLGVHKDCNNYLTTAAAIDGPWSDPVFLNAGGFDPSMFHDDDGRSWFLNMVWDHRPDRPSFSGIAIQEYDRAAQKLVGPVHRDLFDTDRTNLEGPHIFKRDGWYYALVAEGGTGFNHAASLARSRSVTGPYELAPEALLTTRDDEAVALQKAGHGCVVQTPSGQWYMAHLCGRPIGPDRRCVLGRETAIQKVRWTEDGWLELDHGGHHPAVEVPAPEEHTPQPWPEPESRDDFDAGRLGVHWHTLRTPADAGWLSLTERPGVLRLYGRESVHSLFDQSLVAQPLRALPAVAQTRVEFEPEAFTQMAGLVCWYDTKTHYYLRITHDEQRGKILSIALTDDGDYTELRESERPIGDWEAVYMRATIGERSTRFAASPDGQAWRDIGPSLDTTKLSDDYGRGLHFTAAFVGLACQDIGGTRKPADFDFFELT